ncbi:hypothetical protein CAPTEDRAFT_193943 [Capitella teleta]|uniref:SUEL-type lectin domain-containing protein n=1 Tax=Capitella teleta TaxID=283909 RepID=R7TS52_CAPTE|nr:hypothetical protein CAPTEDRAFT_193943 [Capitella teleta]|eukprot:ELT93840.1 hypothetical protein CAPTEDRAFT_193943 [Capitella teleta]
MYCLIVLALLHISIGHCSLDDHIEVVTSQTCDNDIFQARCPSPQRILISHAKYGHIEVSKCVDAMFSSFGALGCYANVTDIVGSRCNGKPRCEIDGDDPVIVSSNVCKAGLPVYMDIAHVCLPEILTIHHCNPLKVSRQLQYVLSTDLWNQHCFYDADQNLNVAIQADANMKIKLRLRSVHVQQLHSVSIEYADNEEIEIPLNNGEITEVPVDQLTVKLSNQDNVFLIGFQAFGCDDMAAPAYAWVSRDGDVATIGCYHSEYEWKMSCVGSKWIGPRSNCTDKQQAVFTLDILFALIIGVTVLSCAIVITIGYVCLKKSKYTYEANSTPYEMATMMSDPSNTATWQKAKLQGNNDTLILPVNSFQGQTLQLR